MGATTQTAIQKVPVKPIGEVRRLIDKELQLKRERGLCFRCDGKWNVGHRCSRPELSVLLAQEEEEVEMEGEGTEDVQTSDTPVEICLNSVLGVNNPKTLKLRGTILETELVVMIDPGTTHNFISPSTVQKLGIPVTSTGGFGVVLGTGETIRGQGVCRGIRLCIQGIEICEDFLPLTLGNADVILGIEWLEKLGVVTTNWRTLVMKFNMNGQTFTIGGTLPWIELESPSRI